MFPYLVEKAFLQNLNIILKGDETEEAFRELIDERLLKSVDAALTALCIMTSRRMPKQVNIYFKYKFIIL